MTPSTLLLRLDGPLQSWGVASRYARRESLDHPSKSGVIGICAAALGRRRSESIEDLAGLRFGVLVVDPGRMVEDYQTVSHAVRASKARRVDLSPAAVMRAWTGAEIARQKLPSSGDVSGNLKTTELTWRMYVADALFVAGLEGDVALLETIREALRSPVFPLSLGRAACLPAAPIGMSEREDGGLCGKGLEAALRSVVADARGWCAERHSNRAEGERRVHGMRLIVECEPQDATIRVQDQPTPMAFATRTFTTRYARALNLEGSDA